MSLLLIVGSVLNALYLFTRVKLYRLHNRPDPVSSPSAKFVPADLDFEPLETPSLISRVSSAVWYAFCASWRFLLNMRPRAVPKISGAKMSKVQQLDVWAPGDLETWLFSVYSPVHSLLWMATTSANWMLMLAIMAGVGVQVSNMSGTSSKANWSQMRVLTRSYTTLVKDKEIIAAEVMHEYNTGVSLTRLVLSFNRF